MNREIKFRAKCKDNGEWVYGSYITNYNNNDWIVQDGDFFAVDSDTAGQFTGFYDRDGKEIYEDDIFCDVFTNVKYFVFFSSVTPSLCFMSLKNKVANCKIYNTFIGVEIYGKVLGNRYDNPELTKND